MIALPCLLYSMDLTVLNLAVPRISVALHPSGAELLWILDIYGFSLAGFLIPMGNLGDRIGRRRLMLLGAVAFGVCSVAAAFSTSAGMLIASRAVLGIAAATLAPSTLSLIRNMFLDPRQRTVAVSVWASFSAGAAIGPMLGGLLLQRFWWGSVFLLAVPVMALLLILGPAVLPEFRDPNPRKLDLASAALSLLAVLLVIYGIKQFAQAGLDTISSTAIAAGLVIGAAFIVRQARMAEPLIDLRLFRMPVFRTALAVNLLGLLAFDGAFLFIAQYLQLVAGLSPWVAAIWTLPWAAGLVIGSLAAPFLVRWFPLWLAISTSLVVAAAGFLLLTTLAVSSGPLVVAVWSALFSIGISPAIALATDVIVGVVPPERAGMASGLSETSTELGGALGIALLGSIGLAVYRSQVAIPSSLPLQATTAARNTLGAALAVADQLTVGTAAMLKRAALEAFTQGLRVTGLISAGIALALAIVAAVALRRPIPVANPAGPDVP